MADASPRIILVTGSTDGIGRFTAFKLAADGFRVLIHGRSREKVAAVVCSVEESGGLADGFVADLSSLRDVRQLAATVT